jgi:hypothetical protein
VRIMRQDALPSPTLAAEGSEPLPRRLAGARL